MSDSFSFTLKEPLTKEDWDKILDVEHENTRSVTFQTPQGKQVRYVKCDVLDKIRAEIEQNARLNAMIGRGNGKSTSRSYFELAFSYGLQAALQIVDKYIAESEG